MNSSSKLENQERSRLTEERKVAQFQLFKETFGDSFDLIYYPGCGGDDILDTTFPQSRILHVDGSTNGLEILKEKVPSAEVYNDRAESFTPDAKVDLLFICGFPASVDLVEHVAPGGHIIIRSAEEPVVAAFMESDKIKLVGTIRDANVNDVSNGVAESVTDATRYAIESIFHPMENSSKNHSVEKVIPANRDSVELSGTFGMDVACMFVFQKL